MSKSVFVVVPSWNGKLLLKKCLNSLGRQNLGCRIVVVDNGSTDGSVEFIKANYPNVQLIRLPKNRGFAGGVNRGIKYAMAQEAKYVALFNNDATADKDWLKYLVERMGKSPDTGIVTGKFLRTNGKIDSVGEAYSIWAQPFPMGRDQANKAQYDEPRPVTAASGGASLYRIEMFKQIGLFDEAFFAYYEDVDVSLRAQAKGWQIWYEPKAVAHHQIGATTSQYRGFAAYHSLKNMLYLYDKNLPGWLFWKYLPRKITSFGLSWLNTLRRGYGAAAFKAPLVVLLTSPALLLKRFQVQRQRQISAQDFDKLLFHAAAPTSRTLTWLSKIFDKKYEVQE